MKRLLRKFRKSRCSSGAESRGVGILLASAGSEFEETRDFGGSAKRVEFLVWLSRRFRRPPVPLPARLVHGGCWMSMTQHSFFHIFALC